MDTDIVVTTVYDPTAALEEAAQRWARLLHAPFVARGRTSLKAIMETHGTSLVLVGAQEGPVVYTPGGRYFFHLSMAELRIKNLRNGKHDHMITAMKLKKGMSVLDCTLGLTTDAIVASFDLGKDGLLVGLEHSPIIA
ncbi:MAG: protein-L-isoaspartate O-methyltransferase, partial [Negativicutes bacterium]|nr:protein-L-isoaspartate O-methyltransferase [Negativicutes bacterium]